MADITQRNKISVHKSGSLHSRLSEAKLMNEVSPEVPVEQTDFTKLSNRIVIMIDQSGSMSGEPIKLLEQAVQDFALKSNPIDTAIAVASFPPHMTEIELTNDKMKLWMLLMGLSAGGGTPMTDCMDKVIHKYPATRCIIVSDGRPDRSPSDMAKQFKSKEIPIDTVHIGDSTYGEDTMKEIAEITGGIFIKFKDIKSFSTAFAFLLPETRKNAATLFLTAGADEVR